MTKDEVMKLANDGKGCLGKAHHDEPLFILRAQDMFAPAIVEAWANRIENSAPPGELMIDTKLKIRGARAIAHQMRAWQELNTKKCPD